MPVLMRENTMIGNLAIKSGERESVSVTGDGEKTIQTLLYELAQKIEGSKINDNSYIAIHSTIREMINTSNIYHIVSYFIYGSIKEIHAVSNDFTTTSTHNDVDIYELVISDADTETSNHHKKTNTRYTSGQTPTMTFSYIDTDTLPAGATINFYY